MTEQTTIVETEGRIHAVERTSQAQPVTIVDVDMATGRDETAAIVVSDGAPFAVVKRRASTIRFISAALFAMAACAVAAAPPMGPLPGGRRRKRRAAEEPYAGPKVEHVEQKGPRRLTRRERKASR